jgi:hypothetical protein
MRDKWLNVPVGIDSRRWLTRSDCRIVLIVAHTIVSTQRLFDVVELIETDQRIQTVYTVAPDMFNHGVQRFLDDAGALTMPWEQATKERFDMALAAAHGGLAEIHAPIVVMAHGAGYGKFIRPPENGGPLLPGRYVSGLDGWRLTVNGRVLASTLVLAHDEHRNVLRRQCPEALEVAVVAGDPAFDRLVASLPMRAAYREAFGIRSDQELVVVSSTWGRDGLYGNAPDLIPRLLDQLSAHRFRVGFLLHPAAWAHGHRQIRAWLRDCVEAGLILLDPADDWRALMVAADHVIGDHGSATAYAASIGRPVLHLTPDKPLSATGSAQALVLRDAPRLDPDRPLLPQIRQATAVDREAVVAALTSRPGGAHAELRAAMYRLLRLEVPGKHRQPRPVEVRRDCAR